MGLGDRLRAHEIININIYEGQTLRMSGWSRIVFASTKGVLKIRFFAGFFVQIFWSDELPNFFFFFFFF